MTADLTDFRAAMHAERSATNTQRVDCWACEAAESEVVQALQKRLHRAEARLARHDALADWLMTRDEQRAMWRDFFRDQLRLRRSVTPSAEGSETPS